MHSLLSSILHNQYPRAETIISEIMAPCIPYMYTKGIEIIGVIVPWIIFILAVALKASNPARAPAWTLFSVEMKRRSAPETIIGDKSGRLRDSGKPRRHKYQNKSYYSAAEDRQHS